MADQPVTREKLINADIDVDNLGKAVNEEVIVSPRYGTPYKSLPMIAREYDENSATKGFNTLAEFEAVKATIPAHSVITIGEDGPHQGQNFWDGATLTKSPNDPLTQGMKYSDSNLSLVKNAANKINMASTMQSFGFEDTGTLLAANDATYLFANPNNSLSTIKLVNFKSGKDGAEIKLKAFLKNGSNFEFSRDLITLASKIGDNSIDLTHQQIILNKNEYLAVSVNTPDALKYVSTSTTYNLYYSAGAYATTIPDTAFGRTARIQLAIYTETDLDKIPNSINELSYKSASLIKLGCQSIETSTTNVGAAQWIPNQASTITGVIRKFSTYATVAGKVQIGVYSKNGVIFTRKRFVEVDVSVGLNTLDINLDIVKGEYAGIRTQVAGLSSYLANNKNAFEVWSGNQAVNEQVYSGPTGGYAWQFNFEIIEKSIAKKSWQDKKVTTFGDSITWYDGRQFGSGHLESAQLVIGYQSYMRDTLGCIIDNKGQSGWDMTQILSVVNSYDFTDVYAVTLTSGANDHRKNVPIGTVGEIGATFDSTTFTGAMQTAIEKIINSNKDIKIFLITPVRGWYYESGTINVPGPYKGEQLLSVDYANAIKSLGRLYSLPVLDWYNEVGFNSLNKNYYLGDNPTTVPFYLLHPNQKGYRRMGESLVEFLRKY